MVSVKSMLKFRNFLMKSLDKRMNELYSFFEDTTIPLYRHGSAVIQYQGCPWLVRYAVAAERIESLLISCVGSFRLINYRSRYIVLQERVKG